MESANQVVVMARASDNGETIEAHIISDVDQIRVKKANATCRRRNENFPSTRNERDEKNSAVNAQQIATSFHALSGECEMVPWPIIGRRGNSAERVTGPSSEPTDRQFIVLFCIPDEKTPRPWSVKNPLLENEHTMDCHMYCRCVRQCHCQGREDSCNSHIYLG